MLTSPINGSAYYVVGSTVVKRRHPNVDYCEIAMMEVPRKFLMNDISREGTVATLNPSPSRAILFLTDVRYQRTRTQNAREWPFAPDHDGNAFGMISESELK